MKIAKDIAGLIGNTPLAWLNRVAAGLPARIAAKLEFFDPASSVKDRIGLAMIEAVERTGKATKDTVILEPTSGNTGIALAALAALLGNRLTVTIPNVVPEDKQGLLRMLGDEGKPKV